MSKTLVVDGTNIVMRSIKAGERVSGGLSVSLDDHTEVNTSGVFLFINTLAKYVKQEQPDRMVICFDGGRSTYRLEIYPDYKSNRTGRLDEQESFTFTLVKEFLTLNGIHHVEYPGVEADDLVAAYSRVRANEDDEVVILSGDKDFLQLVSPRVTQIRPGVKPERWGVEEVKVKFGCFPEDLSKVMALTGDTLDGVPGIPGFGDKTAVKFLSKYEWDLEKLLAAAEPKLVGQEDDVRRNLALVELHPISDGEFEDGFIPEFENDPVKLATYPDLVAWFEKYQMGSLVSRLDAGVLWREPFQGKLL